MVTLLSLTLCVCQVMSRSGRMVGSCELLVVADRVDVDRLVVHVVSAVSLSFAGASAELPRTLVANVTLHSQLTRKYQVHSSLMSLLTTVVCIAPLTLCLLNCYTCVISRYKNS